MLAAQRWRLRRGVVAYSLLFSLALAPLVRQFLPLFRSHPFTYPDDTTPLSLNMSFPVLPRSPICPSSLHLLVVVVSRPSEFSLRMEARLTWARSQDSAVRVLFLLGLPDGRRVREEASLYGDVVVVDVQEDYYNLSVKTLALLVLKNRYCKRVKCVVKADSDNVLHLRNQLRLCDRLSESFVPQERAHRWALVRAEVVADLDPSAENLVVGSCDVNRLVNRDASSKWFVPKFVYAPKRYPKYCSSGSYMFVGRRTVRALLDATVQSGLIESANMRKLPEDVVRLLKQSSVADLLGAARRGSIDFEEDRGWLVLLRTSRIRLRRERVKGVLGAYEQRQRAATPLPASARSGRVAVLRRRQEMSSSDEHRYKRYELQCGSFFFRFLP